MKRILGTAEDYRRLYGELGRSETAEAPTPAAQRRPRRRARRRRPKAKKKAAPAKKHETASVTRQRPKKSAKKPRVRQGAGLVDATEAGPCRSSRGSKKGHAVHRVGHPRDDAAGAAARRRQPVAGLSRFPAPDAIKDAACAAISGDVNQYAITWGAPPAARGDRARVHAALRRRRSIADEQVTVCCGSTEAMMATLLAIVDPGDEVVIFEPFYENYGPDAILSGATPRFVRAARAGLDASTPTSSPPRSTTRTQRHHHQHAEQPDRQGVHARRARARSPRSARSGTRSPSPTRSTSTSSTTASRTCRSRRSTAWRIGRSRSTACRRPSASPAGGWAGRFRRRR